MGRRDAVFVDPSPQRKTLPWWAGWRLVLLLLAVVIILGTAGYIVIEGWSAWDAFYMTAITITTVGYGEVHPLSRAGEAFTVCVMFAGVGTFFYGIALFLAQIAEGRFAERFSRRRFARMLDDLSGHCILCGFGRMGEIIAREFERQGQRFVVVVGIRRADGKMDFNPEPETAMHPGDDLVVLGRTNSLRDLEASAAAAGK